MALESRLATRNDIPSYLAAGFEVVEEVEDVSGGAPVPLVKMKKEIKDS